MSILQSFVFLDNTSTQAIGNSLSIINGNQITLEVTGTTASVTMEAITDIDSTTWTPIAVINCQTLKVVETITAVGNYIIPVSGLSAIRAKNTGTIGSVKVFGKLVV